MGMNAEGPRSKDELIVEALRYVDRVTRVLNKLSEAAESDIQALILRQFAAFEGSELFIAARQLGVPLPEEFERNEIVVEVA